MRLCASRQAVQVSRAAVGTLLRSTPAAPPCFSVGHAAGFRIAPACPVTFTAPFSTTPPSRLRDFFPAKETPHIRKTPPAWSHPGYTEQEMLSVKPAHREPRTAGDWFAYRLVKFCRWCMDKATGLGPGQQTDMKSPTTAVVAEKPLTETQWVSYGQKLTMPGHEMTTEHCLTTFPACSLRLSRVNCRSSRRRGG